MALDTNFIVAALRSRRGASHKLLQLVGSGKYSANVSVPLVLEYEASYEGRANPPKLTACDVDDILDYVCSVAQHRKVFFLWRPMLKDPKDDMVLELAVEASCQYIVTFNSKDFGGASRFGIRVVTPREFLRVIGELP